MSRQHALYRVMSLISFLLFVLLLTLFKRLTDCESGWLSPITLKGVFTTLPEEYRMFEFVCEKSSWKPIKFSNWFLGALILFCQLLLRSKAYQLPFIVIATWMCISYNVLSDHKCHIGITSGISHWITKVFRNSLVSCENVELFLSVATTHRSALPAS